MPNFRERKRHSNFIGQGVLGSSNALGLPNITTINGVTYTVRLSRSENAFEEYHRIVNVWEGYGFEGDVPVTLARETDDAPYKLHAIPGWSLEYVDRDAWRDWYRWLSDQGRSEALTC